jgi:uncharacterized protein (TIGR03435 family)
MRHVLTSSILTLIPVLAFGQSTAGPPTFEAAAIKPNTNANDDIRGKARILAGGRFDVHNVSLKECIMVVYGVQGDMITGAPKWLDSDRFDIVAQAPPDTPEPTLLLMFQTLLAERFRLTIHREYKVTPVFALVVAKGGPKLQIANGSRQHDCVWLPRDDGLRHRECHNMTMAQLVSQLPGMGGAGIDRPVQDLTGLSDAYDLQFEFRTERPGSAEGVHATAESGPTIFDAMAQLGLKLESRKQPMPIIVIDHVERAPTEN